VKVGIGYQELRRKTLMRIGVVDCKQNWRVVRGEERLGGLCLFQGKGKRHRIQRWKINRDGDGRSGILEKRA